MKNIHIYSLLASSLALVGLPLYIYLPTFYTNYIGLDIAIVGLLIFCARLTDIITDPIIGKISDNFLRKYNTRKPLVVLGSIILTISFYYLIHPNIEYSYYWLFIFSVTIYLGWSMINIPYITWSSEISRDYEVKNRLNAFRESFTLIGVLIALSAPIILNTDSLDIKVNQLFIMYIFIFIPSLLLTLIYLKPTINSYEKSNFSIFKIYKEFKNLKYLHTAYLLNNIANAIPATLFLLFVEFYLKEKDYTDEILILYFLSGLIFLPLWLKLSKTVSKKQIWILSILLSSFSFLFVIFLEENDLIYFLIISFISGASLGADIAFPTSIQTDIAQKSDISENKGFIFGIWTMITKFSLAFSIVIAFGILGFFDFDPLNLSKTSILALLLTYGLLPIFFKLFALYFIFKIKEENP